MDTGHFQQHKPTGMYSWPDIDKQQLRDFRLGRTNEVMASHELDHLLLVCADHIRYTTDFRSQLAAESDWFVAVVDRAGLTDVFVHYVDELIESPDPELPHLRAMQPLTSWLPAAAQPKFWVAQVSAELRRRNVRRVGHDSVNPVLLTALQQELPEVHFQSVEFDMYEIRRVKHPLEVQLIEASCRVTTAALESGASVAAVGLTDYDVLAEAIRFQTAAGAEYVSHSLCNLRKGSGDWFANGSRFNEGDPFFFDIGCYGVGGYASDAARTGFVGEPKKAVYEAYEHLLTAHQIGQDLARPGAKASQIQIEVNRYLAAQGLGITPYGIGHGIGLRNVELPAIHRLDRMENDAELLEGETIALEPETSLEVDGELVVLKIEDNFVIESWGARALTVPPGVDDFIIDPS